MYLPSEGGYRYPYDPIRPGQTLALGSSVVRAIATPGHTPEHLSYLVGESDAEPAAAHARPVLFSGGSLIVGGAARTDLIDPHQTVPLTRALHRTLRTAFSGLSDGTRLMPTHGGGSFCSIGGGQERTSTLGAERRTNPMLQFDDEDEFVEWFPQTFPSAPAYYFRMRAVNQARPRLLLEVPPPGALPPEVFASRLDGGGEARAVVVDARPFREYAAGHIRGAISIEYRDGFGVWVGSLVPPDAEVLFVAGGVPLWALVDECLLVGYENFGGFLAGGMEAWKQARLPFAQTGIATAADLKEIVEGGAAVLDVREESERQAAHLERSSHVPVIELPRRIGEVRRGQPILAHCAHGPRAASAASLLEREGFEDVRIVAGGMQDWLKAGLHLVSG
jgi:rhodanese-related sulfurtransferase